MSRLSKSGRKLQGVSGPMSPAYKLDVWTLPSMQAATANIARRLIHMPERDWRKEIITAIPREAMGGDEKRLAAALSDSESLIAEAITSDPRLARRSQWRRGEEGEVVCPALLSEGDDAPCFYRARAIVGCPNGAEPVRVVISTDGNEVPERTAAAFIATCRLVQQYRPIEVWWQGSWLTANREAGWVFHVPLVNGDMDFSRLEFCIASTRRDNLSWAVMMVRACEDRTSWNGCNVSADRSYLPDAKFVSHKGISPYGDSIAYTAATWLGWQTMYDVSWERKQAVTGALQSLPEPAVAYKPLTDAERARYREDAARYERERQERDAKAAAERAAALSYNYS